MHAWLLHVPTSPPFCVIITFAAPQLRKDLDLHVNLVHGVSIPGLKTRHNNTNIVVIRWVIAMHV